MTKGGQSSQSLPDDDLRYTLRPWEAGATFEMLRLNTEHSCVFDKGKKTGKSPEILLLGMPLLARRHQTELRFLWKAQISGKEVWQQCD